MFWPDIPYEVERKKKKKKGGRGTEESALSSKLRPFPYKLSTRPAGGIVSSVGLHDDLSLVPTFKSMYAAFFGSTR